MALPLMAGERIIGALDVQSKQSNAFSQSEVELFTILADQIAIAIVNNRLYEETAHALVEMQNLHRQYMRQEWGKETAERDRVGYLYTPQGVIKQDLAINSADIQDVLDTSRIIIRTDQSEDQSTSMAVPIILSGETIGVIQLQESGTAREWSDDEIATVQAVAEQVALALENARLFEQTVRRAERERKVLEITSKIRSTTDPQAMLRIALEELQKALNASRTQIVLQQSDTIPEVIAPGDNGYNQT
jgi:GAF domain-containing protein